MTNGYIRQGAALKMCVHRDEWRKVVLNSIREQGKLDAALD